MPDIALQILQISDLHLLSESGKKLLGIDTEITLTDILAMISHYPAPDLVLVTGDLVQDAETATYERLIKILTKLNVPCYCLPGNHDDFQLMQQLLNTANLSTTRQVIQHGWQIVLLNSQIIGSEAGHLDEHAFEALSACLEENRDLHTLVTLHHNPVPTGSRWLDTMVVDNGELFLEKLQQYPNVKGVLFGHIHQDFHQNFNGIQLIGTPSTCFQFKPQSVDFALDAAPPGCRWLTLYDDGTLKTRVDRLDSLPNGFDFNQTGY